MRSSYGETALDVANAPQEQVFSAEDIYNTLREEILTLKLPPGAAISETDLARRFQISRTPVRSAIAKLRGEELVRVLPQKGTYVTRLHFEYVMQLIYMREKVEHHVIQDAISRRTPQFLEHIRSVLERQYHLVHTAGTVDESAFFQTDNELHKACYVQAGKAPLWDRLYKVDNQYIRYRFLYYSVSRSFQMLYEEHFEMCEIIEKSLYDKVESFCKIHLNGDNADLSALLDRYRDCFVPGSFTLLDNGKLTARSEGSHGEDDAERPAGP